MLKLRNQITRAPFTAPRTVDWRSRLAVVPSRRASGGDRERLGRSCQPVVEALVDLGVVQQREMVGGADVVAVLGLEWDPPGAALSRGAGCQHEDVAK